MSLINIRSANPEDALFIVKCLEEQAIIHGLPCYATTENIGHHLSNEVEEPKLRGVIAELHKMPIGMSLYYYAFRTLLCQKVIYIEDTFVSSINRGKGAARAIFRFYQNLAWEGNAAYVEWSMLSTNITATRAYEKLGAIAEPEFLTYKCYPKPLSPPEIAARATPQTGALPRRGDDAGTGWLGG